jgi:hypothetical protein
MEVVTEAVNNLSISDGAAAAAAGGAGAEGHRKNRIQVSNIKKPLFFYVNLAKVSLGEGIKHNLFSLWWRRMYLGVF